MENKLENVKLEDVLSRTEALWRESTYKVKELYLYYGTKKSHHKTFNRLMEESWAFETLSHMDITPKKRKYIESLLKSTDEECYNLGVFMVKNLKDEGAKMAK